VLIFSAFVLAFLALSDMMSSMISGRAFLFMSKETKMVEVTEYVQIEKTT